MSKLTPPSTQHPLKRYKFFKENYGDCYETRRIELEYPHLITGLSVPYKPVVEKKLKWWEKIFRKKI